MNTRTVIAGLLIVLLMGTVMYGGTQYLKYNDPVTYVKWFHPIKYKKVNDSLDKLGRIGARYKAYQIREQKQAATLSSLLIFKLEDFTCGVHDYGYNTTNIVVTNVSGYTLEFVKVFVRYTSADGKSTIRDHLLLPSTMPPGSIGTALVGGGGKLDSNITCSILRFQNSKGTNLRAEW